MDTESWTDRSDSEDSISDEIETAEYQTPIKRLKVAKTIEPEKEKQPNLQVTKVISEDKRESNTTKPTDNQLKMDTIM